MRTRGTPAELEQLRLVAARMFERDRPVAEIAHVADRDDQTVRRWRRAWRAGGVKALRSRPRPGPTPRMDRSQWQQVPGMLAQEPRTHGFDVRLWTAALIGKLIERTFGVSCHHDYVGEMLHKLGFSPQRPAKQARERDEAAIAAWRQEAWPGPAKKVDDATR